MKLVTYELWSSDGSECLIGTPREDLEGSLVLHEPNAVLRLRFEADSYEEAKKTMDRYCYEDNPDGLVPLNVPASDFLFDSYRCGLSAGDLIRFVQDYHRSYRGYYYGFHPSGAVARVLRGDIRKPNIILAQFTSGPEGPHFPVGGVFALPQNNFTFKYVEKLL